MSDAHDIFLVPGQYESIQAAVAAIERPTTVVVAPGIYRESVVVAHKPYVVIQSAALSRRGVTLVGADGAGVVLLVDHSSVHLSGIHVRSNARMRGISARDAVVSLQDCTVVGNRIADGNGVGAAAFACESVPQPNPNTRTRGSLSPVLCA